MAERKKIAPQVKISLDEMEAYISIPMAGEEYTIEELEEALHEKGVIFGIKRPELEQALRQKKFNEIILAAEGEAPKEGVDGFFEYFFAKDLDRTPRALPDGSVDYWSIKKIEMVQSGQTIACYHPAEKGIDGMSVTGLPVLAKRTRELPPLKGRGFKRSPDNLTYTAEISGKIEELNGRITIHQVYEISGDLDITSGSIEFEGDVVIHGNICPGIQIRAKGNITVDGIVEGADLWSGKDILLRGGMMGQRSTVFAKGEISARFFEYTTIEAWGNIQAEVFMNCQVTCRKKITLSGRKAVIMGGKVFAVEGVEVGSIGNDVEIKTEVRVGNGIEFLRRIQELRRKVLDEQESLDRLEQGLQELGKLEAMGRIQSDDPRKLQLLRMKIRDAAVLNADQNELEQLESQMKAARGASIKVRWTVYPGVMIIIDDVKYMVRNIQQGVEYKRDANRINAV